MTLTQKVGWGGVNQNSSGAALPAWPELPKWGCAPASHRSRPTVLPIQKLRAPFCTPFPISILWNCLTRKSAAAPPESTTSRKRKHPSNYSRKKCATPNPLARKPSSPPTPAASCNFAPAPPSTAPTRRSSTSSNSSIEACSHEDAKRRTARTLCSFTSLFLYFILIFRLQKRRRPSRSGGDCCEKGVPSSGEKIVGGKNSNAGRRWRRVRHAVELLHVHSVPARSSLCHRVVRRHGEERRSRRRALNIRQRVGRIAKARIAPLAHHHHL